MYTAVFMFLTQCKLIFFMQVQKSPLYKQAHCNSDLVALCLLKGLTRRLFLAVSYCTGDDLYHDKNKQIKTE